MNNNKIVYSSKLYEGLINYIVGNFILLSSCVFILYLVAISIVDLMAGKVALSFMSFTILLVFIAVAIFLVKSFFYFFRTAFIDTKSFYVTEEAIYFKPIFHREAKIIKWKDISAIDLNSFKTLNNVISNQDRSAIILTLNDGSKEFILTKKAYRNIDKFIAYIKRAHAEKIIS